MYLKRYSGQRVSTYIAYIGTRLRPTYVRYGRMLPRGKSKSKIQQPHALPGSHYSVAGTVQSCLSLWRPAVAQAKIAVQSPQHLRYGPRQLEWSLGVSYDTNDQVFSLSLSAVDHYKGILLRSLPIPMILNSCISKPVAAYSVNGGYFSGKPCVS